MTHRSPARSWLLGLVAAGLLASAAPRASADPLEVGETPPAFVGKEFINTPDVDMKALKGRVIVYEIFRTW